MPHFLAQQMLSGALCSCDGVSRYYRLMLQFNIPKIQPSVTSDIFRPEAHDPAFAVDNIERSTS